MRQQTILGTFAFVFGIILYMSVVPAQAGELVYRPLSPSFGGNTFVADHLMSTAQIQNQFTNNSVRTPSDPIDDFANTLQRRLLSELSRDITEAIFGEGAEDSGTFTIEDTVIGFETIGDQIQVTITDGDGATTSISLPDPNF